MLEKFTLAIIGAGPGGLSAASRAAACGVPHVLLEAAAEAADTVHRYPKGKLVMAEPAALPLRSSLPFVAGTRESVLAGWREELTRRGVNLRTASRVTDIVGRRGAFVVQVAGGAAVAADSVVLAIGLQGNIRRLGVPGEDLPAVQYQLDDPDDYRNETIVVVGGGDSGIETALALATHNRVILLNRQEEFTNCREANYIQLRDAVARRSIEVRTGTAVVRVDADSRDGYRLNLATRSASGTDAIRCHRIVARIGAMPPRQTLERFGIRFTSDDPRAAPPLSEQHESNVEGLYVIGSVAGYPFIKQALNQGYEVVEHILGRPIVPADEAFLLEKLTRVCALSTVREGLERLRGSQPLLDSLSTRRLRELLFDSEVRVPAPGELIFRKNAYGDSFFSILRGSVQVDLEREEADGSRAVFTLGQGDLFGEIGLLSGRRRSATITAGDECVLIETPRRTMLRLMEAEPRMKRRLDEISMKRVVRNLFGTGLDARHIDELVHAAQTKALGPGEVIFKEGDEPDGLYWIRRGSVAVCRRQGDRHVVLAYVQAGHYIGEISLITKTPRTATVRAAAPTEVVFLEAGRFRKLLEQYPAVWSKVTADYLERLRSNESARLQASGEFVHFLIAQGLGEATDALLIDHTKCIRCNNCEEACADAHDGISRLNRSAGKTFQYLHIPVSCRHCEHPRCMQDCQPDAIYRSDNGEVIIGDNCIGCGNCQRNCNYGVIRMARKTAYRRPSLLQALFGRRPPPPDQEQVSPNPEMKAVKCDMCRGIVGGAVCVRACPTGAACRVGMQQLLDVFGHQHRPS